MKKTQTDISSQKNLIFGVVAVLLIASGLILTEVQQYRNRVQIQENQREQAALISQAQEVLQDAIKKTLNSSQLEFKDTEIFNVYGCNYSSIYTGKYHGNNAYVKKESHFENQSAFKNICPKDYADFQEYYNGEYYWSDTQQSVKPEGESKAISTPLGSGMNVQRPQEYLFKYFRVPSIIKSAKKENGILIINATATDRIRQADYVFTITHKDNTLNKFTYSRKEKDLTTKVTGTVELIWTQ